MFLISSLFIVLLFGLGWLVASPVLPKKNGSFFEFFPFVILCGLIANYALVLIFQSIFLSLKLAIVLASTGMLMFARSVFRGDRPDFFSASRMFTFWSGVILIFYLVAICSEPLIRWDARSIWFFHAKMIFSAKALSFDAGWSHPSVFFSNVGYPKLVPLMAAQLADIVGYWNEYFPKLSLIFIMIPPIFWLISFARKSWSFGFLLCVFPFSLYKMMWNGYMDGHLALYLAVALILLGRYIKFWRPMDFFACAACFLFLPNLKREGLLLLFLGLISVAVTGYFLKKHHRLRVSENIEICPWQWISWLTLSLPTFLWYFFYLYAWGIASSVKIFGEAGSSLPLSRLSDGVSLKLIASSMFAQIHLPIAMAALMLVFIILIRKRLPFENLPPLLVGFAYSLGLIVTYLALEFELNWALTNSTDRTTLAIGSCLYVSVFFALQYFERLETALRRKQLSEFAANKGKV